MATSREEQALDESAAIREFILWARKNHIVVAHVRIGDVEATFHDPAAQPTPVLSPTSDQAAARESIYQEFGGDMMKPTAPAASEQNEPTEEDEDD